MMKKIFSTIMVALMIVLSAAGCSNNNKTVSSTEVDANKSPVVDKESKNEATNSDVEKEIDEIVMCESEDFTSGFALITNSEEGVMHYLGNFYETLVNYEHGEIKPGLAESWEVNNNEITFKLREGVEFCDGSNFNAEVVKKNFEMLPKILGEERIDWYGDIPTKLEKVEIIDNYTVRFVFAKPYYAALQDLTMLRPMGMMSLAVFTEDGLSDELKFKSFGTGPYKVESIVEGQEYTFVRNDNYWGKKPKVKQFVVKIIPDMESRIMALRAGEIDMIVGANKISYDAFSEFKNDDKFVAKVSKSKIRTRNISLNSAKEPFDDKNVRIAVQYAIDKQSICDDMLYGIEEKSNNLLNTELPYCDVDVEPYKYNKEKAEKLLEEAGWIKVEGSSIREKNGRKLEADIAYKTGIGTENDIALAYAEQLKEVGFDMKVNGLESMAFWERVIGGNFTMAASETFGIPYDPHLLIKNMNGWSVEQASIEGLSEKPEIDLKITELYNTAEQDEIQQKYDYILTTLHEEGVFVPISYTKELVIFSGEKVNDYKFNGQPTNIDISGIVSK